MFTEAQLVQIYPSLAKNPRRLQLHYRPLYVAMSDGGITSPIQMAAYLAQIGHETSELKYMSEIWGPTEQQKKYERPPGAPLVTSGPIPLWQKLGNTEPGDGFRYRGAGPIQLTGRANFREAGKAIGVDIENNPNLAFAAPIGHKLGVYFWNSRGLNLLAIKGDFDAITKKINGGFNGKEDRDRRYALACQVLEVKP